MFRMGIARFAFAFLLLVASARGVDKEKKNSNNLVPRAPLPALASHPIRLLATQVPSSVPFRFDGSYRITFKSSVLPGDFSFGFGFNGQREFAPSTQRIRRSFDPAGCAAVDEKLLGPFLADDFGLSAEQAQLLARDLLASEVTIEESARITIQSVGFFAIFNAALQVFGD